MRDAQHVDGPGLRFRAHDTRQRIGESCVRTDSSKTLQRTPLRVAVMIRGDSVPRWVPRVLDRIDASSSSELVGFVLDNTPRSCPPTIARLWAGRSRLLYMLYYRETPVCRLEPSWQRGALGRTSTPAQRTGRPSMGVPGCGGIRLRE
jgi:hypothetical protein